MAGRTQLWSPRMNKWMNSSYCVFVFCNRYHLQQVTLLPLLLSKWKEEIRFTFTWLSFVLFCFVFKRTLSRPASHFFTFLLSYHEKKTWRLETNVFWKTSLNGKILTVTTAILVSADTSSSGRKKRKRIEKKKIHNNRLALADLRREKIHLRKVISEHPEISRQSRIFLTSSERSISQDYPRQPWMIFFYSGGFYEKKSIWLSYNCTVWFTVSFQHPVSDSATGGTIR